VRTEQDFLGDREIPRAESVTLVLALNPIVGDEKAATIAKTAPATGARAPTWRRPSVSRAVPTWSRCGCLNA